MRKPATRFFSISFLIGFVVVFAAAAYDNLSRPHPQRSDANRSGLSGLSITVLNDGISVAPQIDTNMVAHLKAAGYASIIDLRPDGEAPEQPPAQRMAATADLNWMKFFYVPVPHGDTVPDATVEQLSQALSASPRLTLLYCRSGRRATRAWSLAEASRPGGLDADTILHTARRAGHAVDDLQDAISARIARRSDVQVARP